MKKFLSKIFKKSDIPENSMAHYTGRLKHGGYAIVITAVVLAAIVIINYGVSALSKKVKLEYDVSGNFTNTLSPDNEKYIKSLKSPVEIIVCSSRRNYTSGLMEYAQQAYRVTGDDTYFNQTLYLLDKYAALNSNIKLSYLDTASTEYTAITQQYASANVAFGDIIVRLPITDQSGITKYKHLSFSDIYATTDPSGYAAYGYDNYVISGSKLENSLSSSISYVLSEKIYKVGIVTGHAAGDNSSYYKKLLTDNNYEVQLLSDSFVSKIPDDLDALAIIAPTVDFISSETDAISEFLDNDGKGGKGLIYFADASTPALPNLYELLSEWGIYIDEGILLETEADYIPDESMRSALFVVPTDTNSNLTKNMNGFITGYNVPMTSGDAADEGITVTEVAKTLGSVITVPAGTAVESIDVSSYEQGSYSGIIESAKEGTDAKSYVVAFGSIEYIDSDWAENPNVSNKDVVLNASEHICGADKLTFSFVDKSITSESFKNEITETDAVRVRNIFMFAFPIVILIVGFVIFFKRRNSR